MTRATQHHPMGRGFTLLEALIGITLLSVILLAAQSAVLMAGRALPRDDSRVARLSIAAHALDVINEDVAFALSIEADSPRSFTIVLADRNGDDVDETVRYEWSGEAGDPLLRQYNSETPTAIASDVHQFEYELGRLAIAEPTTYTEGPDVFMSGLDAGLLNLDTRVRSNNWVAQYFEPSMPPNAVSWRVTRAYFRARSQNGTGGETAIQIRLPDGTTPSPVVLEQSIMYENSLSTSYQWREIPFTDWHAIPANSGACLTFQWLKDAESCELQYRSLLLSGTAMSQSGNAGFSWTAALGDNLIHAIIGRITTTDPPIYKYRLATLQCTIAVGSPSDGLTASARVLNQPEVSGP